MGRGPLAPVVGARVRLLLLLLPRWRLLNGGRATSASDAILGLGPSPRSAFPQAHLAELRAQMGLWRRGIEALTATPLPFPCVTGVKKGCGSYAFCSSDFRSVSVAQLLFVTVGHHRDLD